MDAKRGAQKTEQAEGSQVLAGIPPPCPGESARRGRKTEPVRREDPPHAKARFAYGHLLAAVAGELKVEEVLVPEIDDEDVVEPILLTTYASIVSYLSGPR